MPNRLALVAALATVAATSAHAEGERGPMFGGGVLGSQGAETSVAGIGAELVQWYGRLGLGAEASRQWSVDMVDGPQVGTLAASLRVLAFAHVVPSLLDAREVVDLGIELHGIVERAWWDGVPQQRVSYGLGVALRLRGATDDDRSNVLAESRVFVRALRAREAEMDFAARDTSPGSEPGGVTVIIGLGALWGAGQTAYVDRLRRRNELDSEYLVGR